MHISEKAYNQNRKQSSKKANSANQNGIINKSNSFQCKSGQVKGVGGGVLQYFSVSDWPKSHAQFIITSYCRRILWYVNWWHQSCSKIAGWLDYWMVNQEGLGTRLSCFWWWVQNSGTFQLFHGEEVGKLFTKNIARTTRRQPCYLGNICKLNNSLSPKLLKMNLTLMG